MSNSGFRGFADFANSSGSTTAAVLAAARSKKKEDSGSTQYESKSKSLRPSPIYTGSDQRLVILFRKIGQKRDATTRCRALGELVSTVFPKADPDNAEEFSRPEKIASLCHLVFLHETKLGYDNNPSVRAGSYRALTASKAHVPKAWDGLFLGSDDGTLPVAASTVGMAWAASRGDPSAVVVRCAGEFVEDMYSTNETKLPSTIQIAVLNYSKLVLGCKRASALQDVINPVSTSFSSSSENQVAGKDKKNKAAKSAKNADAVAANAESEREELEERYERVVLSVLIGLGSLVECQPEAASQPYATTESFPDAASIIRLMQSSRGSFRRESCNLVGKFCQFAQSLVLPADETTDSTKLISLASLIPNIISAEKDPSNFVSLLELILSYLSMYRSRESTTNTDPWETMDAFAFTKSLNKTLRRACCGAPANNWGPMILPIVASIPRGEVKEGDKADHPLSISVIESLWEGRKSAVGTIDTAAIVSSVAECTTYLLLRHPKDSSLMYTSQSWMVCGQLFLDCLSYFLNEAPDSRFGPAGSSVDELCTTISRDIKRLDAASVDDGTDVRGVTQIKSFLWGDGGMQKAILSTREKQTDVNLTLLISNIMSSTGKTKQQSSHLVPSMKALFREIIVHSDTRTNKSSTKEEVELILKIIQFCGAQNLFPIQNAVILHSDAEPTSLSLEEFCVNNLIRWILLHSKCTTVAIPTDFSIGKCLILSITSLYQQKQVWETILRELIRSFCDVTTLAVGLCAMASDMNGEANVDLIRCNALDQFAIDKSDTFMSNFWHSHDLFHTDNNDEAVAGHQGNMSLFFKTCVGMSDCKSILVSPSVIKHWVGICCDESKTDKLILEDEAGSNALLETLLLLGASPGNTLLTQDEIVKLTVESWAEGGPIWSQSAVEKYSLMAESEYGKGLLRDEIVSVASTSLRRDIRRNPPSDHAIMELTCQEWSKKAARLLEVSKTCSLQDVGIDLYLFKDIRLRDCIEFKFLNIMYLLHSVDSLDRRRELLLGGPEGQDLFVHIQSSITETENSLLQSFQHQTKRNRQLIEALDGRFALADVIQRCSIKCVDLLVSYMKEPRAEAEILCHQTLTTLSYFISLLFPTKWTEKSKDDDCILAEDVKEGDSLWYEKVEHTTKVTRVKATIVKVHIDDFPNLYFTIKEENAAEERQTVASRLKRNPHASSEPLSDSDDSGSREYLGRYILDHLVTPFLSKLQIHDDLSVQNETSAECINIILSQIGTVAVGIGSVRYEIVQTLSSLERCFCESNSATNQDIKRASSLLRCISLAMGFGVFAKSSAEGNLADLKLSTDGIFTCLLDIYDDYSLSLNQKRVPAESIHSSAAMWLAVATSDVKDGVMLRRLSTMILLLCDRLLSSNESGSSMLVMKAIVAFQASSQKCIDYSSIDSHDESLIFQKVTECFASIPEASDLWLEMYVIILKRYHKEVPGIVLNAAGTFSDNLCDCLIVPAKRWCAFQLLMVHAKENKPTYSSEGVTIPPAGETLLSQWTANLDEDEAIELEGDIQVTSLWLSEKMMILLNTFGQQSIFSASNAKPDCLRLSKLLSWILFLEIFDKAGAVDMRNRSSISTFLQKTNAIGSIMNLALEEANLDVGRKENIFECISLDGGSDFILKEVATLVLFRTIESLPTIVKTWFNDDCPRYLQQKMMTFVENKVAPETLDRELARIKDATSFGEMSVNGSTVSREVIATYHQDECQLSVTVRIPPTFPLRNVEVDCQKTLGIAEKRWRRWALNIMMMLNNQDGSILDALLLWKENVDKEFEGVEPCPVCYSVLCIKTHSMPNLQCKTCNNRFHSQCLHKWFQSSGKSNCVLCQQPWSGTRVA